MPSVHTNPSATAGSQKPCWQGRTSQNLHPAEVLQELRKEFELQLLVRDCQSTLAGVLPLTLLTQVSVTLMLHMTEEVKHCYSS